MDKEADHEEVEPSEPEVEEKAVTEERPLVLPTTKKQKEKFHRVVVERRGRK